MAALGIEQRAFVLLKIGSELPDICRVGRNGERGETLFDLQIVTKSIKNAKLAAAGTSSVCALSDTQGSRYARSAVAGTRAHGGQDALRTAVAGATRSVNFLQDLYRIQRALGRLFMFEVGEDISSLPQMLPDSIYHGATLIRRVGRLAVAVIAEVSSHHVGRDSFFGFGDAECAVAILQQIEDFIGEPRRIAEFECCLDGAG